MLFFQALEDTWARARKRPDASAEDRADLYLAGTHAVQASSEVVRHVADIAATTMITKGETLERIGRDMETLRHHGFVNESRYASVAQALGGRTRLPPIVALAAPYKLSSQSSSEPSLISANNGVEI